ncbi:hypothetical protein ADL21_06290 [Streptomyces albus subsp. albus]|nr:hypothetical protein ADL21_06290 [Streptomyces albus subsp. albus]
MSSDHDVGHPPPDGLGPRALALWTGTVDGLELEAGELVLLHEACRLVDDIDAMQAALAEQGPVVKGSRGQPAASPLIRELRAHKLAVTRILRTLMAAMPEEEEGERLTASQRGRKAAVSRWHGARANGTVRQMWPGEAS